MTQSNISDRLTKLATYARILRDDQNQFVEDVPLVGTGTSDDPYVMGTGGPALTEVGNVFVQMAYDTGWVVQGFDWSNWASTDECNLMRTDRDFLARADEDQVAKLLTALIRADRFSEGTLEHAFTSGLILVVAERAEMLAKTG